MQQQDCFEKALKKAAPSLRRTIGEQGLSGTERLLRDAIAGALGARAEIEVPYARLGGCYRLAGDPKRLHLDVLVDGSMGLELKVMEFPRLSNLAPSKSLYHIGGISWDCLRIQRAKHLVGGIIVVLLVGPLVTALPGPGAIARELHNRLFIDFALSSQRGQLAAELKKGHPMAPQRRDQVAVLKGLGLTEPFSSAHSPKRKVFVRDEFALWLAAVPRG